MIFKDATGDIFLAWNLQESKCAKYIDLKHYFIREFTEDRNGVWQGSIYNMHADLNTEDIGTRNVDAKVFKIHETELDMGVPMLKNILR